MARSPKSKLVERSDLYALGERLRSEGKKIVSTNGCFDLLHWGHIDYLCQARALGDCLVCALNVDSTVRALKGNSRPLQPLYTRLLQSPG